MPGGPLGFRRLIRVGILHRQSEFFRPRVKVRLLDEVTLQEVRISYFGLLPSFLDKCSKGQVRDCYSGLRFRIVPWPCGAECVA